MRILCQPFINPRVGINRLYPNKKEPLICFQEAPGDGYYHRDSIRYAFDYVLYKYISRRTDHLPTTIYSRYPIHSVKALYYKNSSNMSLIADVRINNQYIRVINNHFETTSVNAYRGIITAPGKSLEVRAKAVKDLILKMKNNYLKRAEQADSIHVEVVTNIPSVSYTNSGGLITFSIRNR